MRAASPALSSDHFFPFPFRRTFFGAGTPTVGDSSASSGDGARADDALAIVKVVVCGTVALEEGCVLLTQEFEPCDVLFSPPRPET